MLLSVDLDRDQSSTNVCHCTVQSFSTRYTELTTVMPLWLRTLSLSGRNSNYIIFSAIIKRVSCYRWAPGTDLHARLPARHIGTLLSGQLTYFIYLTHITQQL